jgi:hypothetical protein
MNFCEHSLKNPLPLQDSNLNEFIGDMPKMLPEGDNPNEFVQSKADPWAEIWGMSPIANGPGPANRAGQYSQAE